MKGDFLSYRVAVGRSVLGLVIQAGMSVVLLIYSILASDYAAFTALLTAELSGLGVTLTVDVVDTSELRTEKTSVPGGAKRRVDPVLLVLGSLENSSEHARVVCNGGAAGRRMGIIVDWAQGPRKQSGGRAWIKKEISSPTIRRMLIGR